MKCWFRAIVRKPQRAVIQFANRKELVICSPTAKKLSSLSAARSRRTRFFPGTDWPHPRRAIVQKKMPTIREALNAAAERLAPSPSARRDAELLLMFTLGCSRAHLLAYPRLALTTEQSQTYDQSIARRAAHEPIQYITGQQEFYGLPFRVTPDVLIPRPETEHLVEAALARLPRDRPLRIADVGTGSGAIAVALAHALPLAHVTALDISPAALAIARLNAEANKVSTRIRFLESDLLSGQIYEIDGKLLPLCPSFIPENGFDAIVSNPPYVPESDRATLEPQVRDHEPATALFSGPTGLEIYQRLIPQAHALLAPGGWLLMEIGFGQQPALAQLFATPPDAWQEVTFLPDLQSIPRVALARRACPALVALRPLY
jgi:release factor glutamine methyltransferase